MDRIFLDANVLFSASYREYSGLSLLWQLPDVELITSLYALNEARRNTVNDAHLERLDSLALVVSVRFGFKIIRPREFQSLKKMYLFYSMRLTLKPPIY